MATTIVNFRLDEKDKKVWEWYAMNYAFQCLQHAFNFNDSLIAIETLAIIHIEFTVTKPFLERIKNI